MITTTAATFGITDKDVEVKPAYAQREMSSVPPAEYTSSNPDDCRYWCYKGYLAEYTTVSLTTLASDASFDRTATTEQTATYSVLVLDQSARGEEIEISAEYANITKTVLKSDVTPTKETLPSTS